MNKDGKVLGRFLEEREWGILNGCMEGDEEGDIIHIYWRERGHTHRLCHRGRGSKGEDGEVKDRGEGGF